MNLKERLIQWERFFNYLGYLGYGIFASGAIFADYLKISLYQFCFLFFGSFFLLALSRLPRDLRKEPFYKKKSSDDFFKRLVGTGINCFIRDGQSTSFGGGLLSLFCAAIIVWALNYLPPWWILFPMLLILIALLCVLAVAGNAAIFGLKPFTNDPLGWRKARKAYEQESEQSKLDNK